MNRPSEPQCLTPTGRAKAVARLGVLALCLSLSACGDTDSDGEDTSAASASESTNIASSAVPVEAAAAAAAQALPTESIALAQAQADAEVEAVAAAAELAAEADAATRAEGITAASDGNAVPADDHSQRESAKGLVAVAIAAPATDLVVRARGTLASGLPPGTHRSYSR